MKKSLKSAIKIILISAVVIAIIFGMIYGAYYKQITPESSTNIEGFKSTTTVYEYKGDNLPSKSNVEYEVLTSNITWSSTYEYNSGNTFVTSNEELKSCLESIIQLKSQSPSESEKVMLSDYISMITIDNQELLDYFDEEFFENHNLAVQVYDGMSSEYGYSIANVVEKNGTANINILARETLVGVSVCFNFIVLDKNINKANFDIYIVTTNKNEVGMLVHGVMLLFAVVILVSRIVIRNDRKEEGEQFSERNKVMFKIISIILIGVIIYSGCSYYGNMLCESQDIGANLKPIIYLYPTEDTQVSVELGNSENITVSYPKYINPWNVLAKTDGTLIDLTTNRNLYSLYYECNNAKKFEVTNEGFVVNRENITEFLEEKLAILGLTQREAEEFIIYWLPVLQKNEYNYIRFATLEEIEENMPLIINPEPDTIIRVLMTYKGLINPIEVEEQKLETPERTGFSAVEWGGTQIN